MPLYPGYEPPQQPVVEPRAIAPMPPAQPMAPMPPAQPVYYGYPVPIPMAYPVPQQAPASGTYVAAAVINWVVLGLVVAGTCGLGILAAAWFIPMTIQMHKGARDRRKHTALGVCTLLFCNLVSGILLLIEDGSHR